MLEELCLRMIATRLVSIPYRNDRILQDSALAVQGSPDARCTYAGQRQRRRLRAIPLRVALQLQPTHSAGRVDRATETNSDLKAA